MNARLILRIITVIALCILCLFVGAIVYPLLANLLSSYAGVHLARTGSRNETIDDLLYVLLFTVLPLVILLLWKYIPVYSVRRKVLSVLILLCCIVPSIALRIVLLTRDAQLRRNEMMKTPSSYLYPAPPIYAEKLHLWIYLTGALLLATGLIYLLFREHRPDRFEFSFEQDERDKQ